MATKPQILNEVSYKGRVYRLKYITKYVPAGKAFLKAAADDFKKRGRRTLLKRYGKTWALYLGTNKKAKLGGKG